MAISLDREAARASSRFAMLTQAISSTSSVTPSSSVNGIVVMDARLLCPRRPDSTTITLFLNRASTDSVMVRFNGTSTSLMSERYGTLIAARA